MIEQSGAIQPFSYPALAPSEADQLRQIETELTALTVDHQDLERRYVGNVIDIGQRLVQARDLLRHNKAGGFEAWFTARGYSKRTVYNYVNVFERFGNSATIAQLDIPISSLYLLAAPSMPSEVTETIIGRAAAGEPVTPDVVRDALAATQPEKPTETAADAAYLHRLFADQVVTLEQLDKKAGLPPTRRIRAMNLLRTEQFLMDAGPKKYRFAALVIHADPDPEQYDNEVIPGISALMTRPPIPGEAALHATLEDAAKDAIVWVARELTPTQYQALVALYQGEVVRPPASTCIALTTRRLVEKTAPDAGFDSLKLTDKGHAVAEYLLARAKEDYEKAPCESIEPPAVQESTEPALPAGVTLRNLSRNLPAHSDDHDPNLAQAVLLRARLEKAALDLQAASEAFCQIRSITSLAELSDDQLGKTQLLLNQLSLSLVHSSSDVIQRRSDIMQMRARKEAASV